MEEWTGDGGSVAHQREGSQPDCCQWVMSRGLMCGGVVRSIRDLTRRGWPTSKGGHGVGCARRSSVVWGSHAQVWEVEMENIRVIAGRLWVCRAARERCGGCRPWMLGHKVADGLV